MDEVNQRTVVLTVNMLSQSVLQSLFLTADTFVVSALSDRAVVAIGIASRPLDLVSRLFQIISLGILIINPQLLGDNNQKRANEVSAHGTILAVIFGLLASFTSFAFSKNILSIYAVESEALEKANIYLQIVGSGLVFQSLIIVLTAIIQSYEKAELSMYVSVFVNLVNIGIDSFVVLCIKPSEFMGIICVALSTTLSQLLGAIVLLHLYNREIRLGQKIVYKLTDGFVVLKAGCPAVGETLSYSVSQMVITIFISQLGTEVLSGYIYAMNVSLWLSRFPAAFGKASGIVAGTLIGEKEYLRCKDYALKNVIKGVIITIISGCVTIIFLDNFLRFFSSNENVLEIAHLVAMMGLLALPGRSVNLIVGNVIRSTGNPLLPALVGVGSMWSFGVIGSYLLGLYLPFGIYGMEIAFALDESCRAGILIKYWLSDRWINSKCFHYNFPNR